MNWEIVVGILLFLAVFITGGYAKRFYKESKEVKDATVFLIDVFMEAIKDYVLTEKERQDILDAALKAKREYRDVADLAYEVAGAFILTKKKMRG